MADEKRCHGGMASPKGGSSHYFPGMSADIKCQCGAVAMAPVRMVLDYWIDVGLRAKLGATLREYIELAHARGNADKRDYWIARADGARELINAIDGWPDLPIADFEQWYEQAKRDAEQIPYLDSRRRHHAFRRTYKTPPGE